MKNINLPGWAFSLIAVTVSFATALAIRIALPYVSIFTDEGIRLTGIDSYFYMRLVDNIVHNFPHIIEFDPYLIYPGGDYVNRVPTFFAFMLAGLVKLLGGANPSQQAIDTIAVYLPPLLGALSTIPIFFIGRALVNKWAGLAAALIMAFMPGELLSRSLLGYTDHHVAEVFFTTFFTMFFILAVKNGRQSTADMLSKGKFLQPSFKHLVYSFIAGLFMGLYLITWQGALFFVLIVFVFFIAQFISDYARGFPSDYLSKIAITCFLFALLIFVPVSRDKLTLLAVASLILVSIALNIISSIMRSREVRPVFFAAVLGGLAAAAVLATWLLAPSVFKQVANYLSYIFVWRIDQAIVGEMKPLFFPGGTFDLSTAWLEYGMAFYLALGGLAVITFNAIRGARAEHTFAATWGSVMLLATLAMVRFTYYFGICAALLTGYLLGWAIEAILPKKAPDAEKAAKKAKKHAKRQVRESMATISLVVILFIALLAPGTVHALNTARSPGHMPPPSWIEAMEWLRDNSPEPFRKADFYYHYYNTPEAKTGYGYPDSAYSVMIWSDYGYWLLRMAHRMPVANPAITKFDEARFYTSQDEQSASSIMQKLGSRFVVIDSRIVSPNDKFYALASKSNSQESDYYELCWRESEGRYVPLLVFYPRYYLTMISRMYNFDCRQAVPESTPVMVFEQRKMQDGQTFKAIREIKNFRTYAEAEAFIASDKTGHSRIIGTDPLKSPVPLDSLDNYKVVYQSSQKSSAGSSPMPEVKIFEYKPAPAE